MIAAEGVFARSFSLARCAWRSGLLSGVQLMNWPPSSKRRLSIPDLNSRLRVLSGAIWNRSIWWANTRRRIPGNSKTSFHHARGVSAQ